MSIEKRLEGIRKRAEEAIPEPWVYVDLGKRKNRYGETITQRVTKHGGRNTLGTTILRHEAQWRMQPGNRRFISHARSDIPWLLKYVKMLREELEMAGFSIHSWMKHKAGNFRTCRAIECARRTEALERGPDES